MDRSVQTSQQQITASPGREKRFAPAYRNGGMRGLALTIVTLAAVVVLLCDPSGKASAFTPTTPPNQPMGVGIRVIRACGLVS